MRVCNGISYWAENFKTIGRLANDAFGFHIDKSPPKTDMRTHTCINNEGLLQGILGRVEPTNELKPDALVYLVRELGSHATWEIHPAHRD